MSLAVVAKLNITEGKRDEFLQTFKQMAQWVKQNEPDTLAYQATVNPKNQNQVVIIERYANQDALKKHGGSAEFKKFGKTLKEKNLGSIASVDVYPEVNGVGFTSK